MKKITPVLTEKSLQQAKDGNYTFWVDNSWNKHKISEELEKLYEVEVDNVRTINYKSVRKRNYLGRFREIPSRKKAIVSLKGKGKIDIFESNS